jgi:NTE family protein
MSAVRRGLVLGGGGFAASAWEIGLISGIAAASVDLRERDLFVGTSSGARVALYLACGVDLEQLFEQQMGPPAGPPSSPAPVDWRAIRKEWERAKELGGSPDEILRRVGKSAVEVAGSGGDERRKVVAAQLPTPTWPGKKDLVIVAVNADTGERRAFSRDTGIEVVDAVMATSAFWGWPPGVFEGHRYIDGGFYSSDNADLAAGCDEVLILALRAPASSLHMASLDDGVKRLRESGAKVEIVQPDEECMEALGAGSPMNPAVRGPAAKAGRAQGRRIVERGLVSFS